MIGKWQRLNVHLIGQTVAIAISLISAGTVNGATGDADLIVINAQIWTGVPDAEDGAKPASAVAIVGDRIVAVGDEAAIRARAGDKAKVIDAKGRRLIPGITDSHLHLVGGGFQLGRLSLRAVADRRAFVDAVANAAKQARPKEWVLGGRWSVESWADSTSPRKEWIDHVTGRVPTFLSRMDGHQALANSAALKLAGITAKGPSDPEGGQIERDPQTDEPTGILKESAMSLVADLIPEPTPAAYDDALDRAMREANAHGITSVHTMSDPDGFETLRRADANAALTLRATVFLSVDDWAAHAEAVEKFKPSGSMLRAAGFKGFMDGSLGSRTAFMREPYADAKADARYPRGQLTAMADPPASFYGMVCAADYRGFQLAVHAIGDQANHLVLEAYEATRTRNGRTDARHRIEHAQHLLIEDIPRFAKLGVVASMQPFHKADDGRYAEKAIGKERLKGSYAFRQLVDSGALVCFGSDWPVVTLNPFAGIDAAVNARTLDGRVWLPSHSLTVVEALRAYTVSPALAVHQEKELGTIEVGKLADMVMLFDDPLTMPRDRLGEIRVAMTIVGGKIVYSGLE